MKKFKLTLFALLFLLLLFNRLNAMVLVSIQGSLGKEEKNIYNNSFNELFASHINYVNGGKTNYKSVPLTNASKNEDFTKDYFAGFSFDIKYIPTFKFGIGWGIGFNYNYISKFKFKDVQTPSNLYSNIPELFNYQTGTFTSGTLTSNYNVKFDNITIPFTLFLSFPIQLDYIILLGCGVNYVRYNCNMEQVNIKERYFINTNEFIINYADKKFTSDFKSNSIGFHAVLEFHIVQNSIFGYFVGIKGNYIKLFKFQGSTVDNVELRNKDGVIEGSLKSSELYLGASILLW